MLKKIAASAAMLAASLGFAASAQAYNSTQSRVAWQKSTNKCLTYAGCRDISLIRVAELGAAPWFYFEFHTNAFGWRCYEVQVYSTGDVWGEHISTGRC